MTKLGMKRKTPKKALRGRPIKGRRGLQRKADTLFSLAVRKRDGNKCEYCGKTGLQLHCHHGVVHRRYLATRYELDNCASVCVGCHTYLGDFPRVNYEWFKKRIGTQRIEQLEFMAHQLSPHFDYQAVIEKLQGILR